MTGNEYGTFLRQIQERGGQDVMLEMLRLRVQTVLEEGTTRHLVWIVMNVVRAVVAIATVINRVR